MEKRESTKRIPLSEVAAHVNGKIYPYALKTPTVYVSGNTEPEQEVYCGIVTGHVFFHHNGKPVYLRHTDPSQEITAAYIAQNFCYPDGSLKPSMYFQAAPPIEASQKATAKKLPTEPNL